MPLFPSPGLCTSLLVHVGGWGYENSLSRAPAHIVMLFFVGSGYGRYTTKLSDLSCPWEVWESLAGQDWAWVQAEAAVGCDCVLLKCFGRSCVGTAPTVCPAVFAIIAHRSLFSFWRLQLCLSLWVWSLLPWDPRDYRSWGRKVSCEHSCTLAGVPHNWRVGAPTRKSKLFSNLQLSESWAHT